MQQFTHEELGRRAFTRVARIMFEQWEEFGSADTRPMNWLVGDEFTLIGISTNGAGRREHLVPRVVLRDICLALFNSGGRYEDAASMLQRLLKVAYISPQEAHHLDHTLGLKRTMPKGWNPDSGDYLARLNAAGITIVPASPRPL